jgi:hypothetical protein
MAHEERLALSAQIVHRDHFSHIVSSIATGKRRSLTRVEL